MSAKTKSIGGIVIDDAELQSLFHSVRDPTPSPLGNRVEIASVLEELAEAGQPAGEVPIGSLHSVGTEVAGQRFSTPGKKSSVGEAKRRLHLDPNDQQSIRVLAAESLIRSNPDRTLELIEMIPGLLHQDPVSNRIAGYAWLAKQSIQQAKECFDQAVRLDPHQTDGWLWLGRIAEHSGDEDQAIGFYKRALILDDAVDAPAIALSSLHVRRRNLKDAIHTLRVCLLRNRRSPAINIALAKLLTRRSRKLAKIHHHVGQQRFLLEALECYSIANAADPNSKNFVDQGLLEVRLERFDDAIRSFEKAVTRDNHSTQALNHLANALVEQGKISDALEYFVRALAIDPGHAHTHFRYTRVQKFSPGVKADAYLEQLNAQITAQGLQRHEAIHLRFAIAKVLDDCGRHDEAWVHYDRANRLKPMHHQGTDSVPVAAVNRQARFVASQDDIVRLFDQAYFDSVKHRGHPSDMPVFIVGMPRSGTTLTEQILSSHPDVAGAGEVMGIDHIRQDLLRRERIRSRTQQVPARDYRSLIAGLTSHEIVDHADRYLGHLRSFRDDERFVTDKMPTNFLHLGLIATLFPNATVVHCRRHPMDVIVSCYCQNLNAPFCDLEMLVGYHRNYRRMMRHWESVLPITIHHVDYESLVTDAETQTRRLIEHCGLEWDQRCLDFHQSDRSVRTPSKWQVRQPMYSHSLQKWRRFEHQLRSIADRIESEMAEESAGGKGAVDRARSVSAAFHGPSTFH